MFGADGIVLDIKVKPDATLFMDCNYWSCYVHEDELLLIGGLESLEFETIRNIVRSENYNQFIKCINMLDNMVKGMALYRIKPYKDDIVCLRKLINFEFGISEQIENNIPEYVKLLFHNFVMKKTEIIINLGDWKQHFSRYDDGWGSNVYGYKRFSNLFGYEDFKLRIDFNLFIKLFPNVVVFTIGDFGIGVVESSIDLSGDRGLKMLNRMESINKLSSSLTRFEIIKPSSSIDQFIQSNQNKFEQNGWKLKNNTFVPKGDHSYLGLQEMLLIEKIKN